MVFQAIWGLSFFITITIWETFPLRHRLWSALCLLIGSGHGWGRQVLRMCGRSQWATWVKRGGRKNPRIFMGWFDQADFFFRKKKNQAFWRKWWLDTLVEHYNNHAIGWLVFLEGKREISQLFASSMTFDHPSQMLIVAQVCLLPSKPCRGRTAHFSTYQTGGTHRHRPKRGDEWGELFVSLRWEYEGYLH